MFKRLNLQTSTPFNRLQTSFQKMRLICPSQMVNRHKAKENRIKSTQLYNNTENGGRMTQTKQHCMPVISAILNLFTIISNKYSRCKVGDNKRKLSKNQCNYFELKTFLTKKSACVYDTDSPLQSHRCAMSTLKNFTAAKTAGTAAREDLLSYSGEGLFL